MTTDDPTSDDPSPREQSMAAIELLLGYRARLVDLLARAEGSAQDSAFLSLLHGLIDDLTGDLLAHYRIASLSSTGGRETMTVIRALERMRTILRRARGQRAPIRRLLAKAIASLESSPT